MDGGVCDSVLGEPLSWIISLGTCGRERAGAVEEPEGARRDGRQHDRETKDEPELPTPPPSPHHQVYYNYLTYYPRSILKKPKAVRFLERVEHIPPLYPPGTAVPPTAKCAGISPTLCPTQNPTESHLDESRTQSQLKLMYFKILAERSIDSTAGHTPRPSPRCEKPPVSPGRVPKNHPRVATAVSTPGDTPPGRPPPELDLGRQTPGKVQAHDGSLDSNVAQLSTRNVIEV